MASRKKRSEEDRGPKGTTDWGVHSEGGSSSEGRRSKGRLKGDRIGRGDATTIAYFCLEPSKIEVVTGRGGGARRLSRVNTHFARRSNRGTSRCGIWWYKRSLGVSHLLEVALGTSEENRPRDLFDWVSWADTGRSTIASRRGNKGEGSGSAS